MPTLGPNHLTKRTPVLANLFMHYAFDMWMAREYPGVAFERYADDGVPRIADGGRDVEAA